MERLTRRDFIKNLIPISASILLGKKTLEAEAQGGDTLLFDYIALVERKTKTRDEELLEALNETRHAVGQEELLFDGSGELYPKIIYQKGNKKA